MSEQDLNKSLARYYKDENIHQILIKLVQYIKEYGMKNQQTRMIKKIFQFAERQMTKENKKIVIKRYLHLINYILCHDEEIQAKYKLTISKQITHHFISMLSIVLNSGPMDMFPEMKFYRKKWAKYITDEAYNSLNEEAIRQKRIDLDKGFTQEVIAKLVKTYKKRKFTSAQIQKYLPASNQQHTETRKGSAVSYESEEEVDKPRKRNKKQSADRSSERRSEYSDMVNPRHSSIIPSNSNSSVNGYGVDPRRPNQTIYPPMQNFYPSHPYFPPNRVNYPPVGQYGAPNMYPPGPYGNNYAYPPNYHPSVMPSMPGYGSPPQYDPYRDPRNRMPPQPRLAQSQYRRNLQKMEYIKSSWSFECKFCGLLISTNQKYDQHMFNHFSQSQKQYEISHSRTEHQKKPNKPLMPSVQEWVQSNRIKTKEQKFVVPIQGGVSTGAENCIICRGELKITWSDDIQSWVYEDAVRTKNTEANKSICHADCFQAIDEFERSSDELVR